MEVPRQQVTRNNDKLLRNVLAKLNIWRSESWRASVSACKATCILRRHSRDGTAVDGIVQIDFDPYGEGRRTTWLATVSICDNDGVVLGVSEALAPFYDFNWYVILPVGADVYFPSSEAVPVGAPVLDFPMTEAEREQLVDIPFQDYDTLHVSVTHDGSDGMSGEVATAAANRMRNMILRVDADLYEERRVRFGWR